MHQSGVGSAIDSDAVRTRIAKDLATSDIATSHSDGVRSLATSKSGGSCITCCSDGIRSLV